MKNLFGAFVVLACFAEAATAATFGNDNPVQGFAQTVSPSALARVVGINPGLPGQGDIVELVIKNPDMVVELINKPSLAIYGPVADAMVSSRNAVVAGGGLPIPDAIRLKVAAYHKPEVLNSVRYTTNWNAAKNTLQMVALQGRGSIRALTVMNAIIFRDQEAASDPTLWAHELVHVVQYSTWGLLGFAQRWVDNSSDGGEVEAPAYAREAEARDAYSRCSSAPSGIYFKPYKSSAEPTENILHTNERLVSPSAKYNAAIQDDGNFVVYYNGSCPAAAVWSLGSSANSKPRSPHYAAMQTTGDIRIIRSDGPGVDVEVWHSSAPGPSGDYFFALDDSGNLVIHRGRDPAHDAGIVQRIRR